MGSNQMKISKTLQLASAAVAAVAFGSAATAADMPVKAPVAPAVVLYDWTGFYVGVHVGYSWGRADNSWNTFNGNSNVGANGFTSSVCPPAPGNPIANAVCVFSNDSPRMNGVIGGAQAGYNWQYRNWLFGAEADIQGSGQRGSQTSLFNSVPIPATPFAGFVFSNIAASSSEKLDWFGTVRGRVGLTQDKWLFYGTGGLAYGQISTSGSAIGTAITNNAFVTQCTAVITPSPGVNTAGTCGLAAWNNSQTRVGWTVGAGVEAVIFGNWTWKAEYLHVDLGKFTGSFGTSAGCFGSGVGSLAGACTPVNPGTGTITSHITDEIIRVGLNYKFNWTTAAVTSRY